MSNRSTESSLDGLLLETPAPAPPVVWRTGLRGGSLGGGGKDTLVFIEEEGDVEEEEEEGMS